MDGVAEQIIKVLNIEQQHEDDDDVNTPLKPSKQSKSRKGRRKGAVGYLTGTPLTVCLVLFSLLFIGSILYGATFSTAETAWLSDGFKGIYTSNEEGHAVVRNLHKQENDWARTKSAATAAGGSAALAAKVKMLEGELAQEKKHDSETHAQRDGWGKQDYVHEVQEKEKKEEAKIRAQVAKEDQDKLHVDSLGLDKKHRKILEEMKQRMHDRNSLARAQAQQDYDRREKEIDSIMPSDDNCPGVHCLRGDASVKPQHRLFKAVHVHPPWHSHYPSETSNVYASHRGGAKKPWVKVSGGETDYARHKAEVNHIYPYRSSRSSHAAGSAHR